MKKILCGTDNHVCVGSGDAVTYQSNGNPVIDGIMAYAFGVFVYDVEVNAIPTDYENYKYCYTPEVGFYLNPDWKEPNENPYGLTDEQIETIEQAYRDRLAKEVQEV